MPRKMGTLDDLLDIVDVSKSVSSAGSLAVQKHYIDFTTREFLVVDRTIDRDAIGVDESLQLISISL